MVGRSVEQYIDAGIAGFHIEDQVVTKRCGHLKGKELASETEWYARIRAAVHARAKTGRDIVIVARTDALQSLGYKLALERLKGALALGADAGNVYQGTPGQGPKELFLTCGLKEAIEFDIAAGGALYKSGV
jgi:2-methylisocitrate lyase-like PEP mutase family enzyme